MKSNNGLVLFMGDENAYIEKMFRLFSDANTDRDLNLYRGSLREMIIEIKNNQLNVVESITGENLSFFDVVYFESWRRAQQQALATTRYLDSLGTPYFSQEMAKIMPFNKIGELATMANKNIRLPHTIISSNKQLKKIFKKQPPISFPLIVKAAGGWGGRHNYLVKNYQQLRNILLDESNKQLEFVVQEFIPNDRDYRCLVFGGEIKLVLERQRDSKSDTHLNNTSAGASGRQVALDCISNEAQAMVLGAAKSLGRSSFAGVDLMFNADTNLPYILEVNKTPHIGFGAEIPLKVKILLDHMEELSKSDKRKQ